MAERLRRGPLRSGTWAAAIVVGLAIAATVAACGGLAVISAEKLKLELAEAQDARAVYDAAEGFGLALLAAELDQRDFLLTGRVGDFTRFEAAVADARTALGRLAAEAPTNPWLGPRLGLLSLLAETRLAGLETAARRFPASPGSPRP